MTYDRSSDGYIFLENNSKDCNVSYGLKCLKNFFFIYWWFLVSGEGCDDNLLAAGGGRGDIQRTGERGDWGGGGGGGWRGGGGGGGGCDVSFLGHLYSITTWGEGGGGGEGGEGGGQEDCKDGQSTEEDFRWQIPQSLRKTLEKKVKKKITFISQKHFPKQPNSIFTNILSAQKWSNYIASLHASLFFFANNINRCNK